MNPTVLPLSPVSPAASTSAVAVGLSPSDFSTLPLPPHTLANLQALGYAAMTPIQAASLPLALAGHDVIAQAKTGSGKTAAYGLALLANLNPRHFAVQALVLCPTRELADQVSQELRRLARAEGDVKVLTLCGGAPIRQQLASLEHGAHVVVGTPGRLMDHLERGSLQLQALNTLVLDEADRMLDMGFFDDIATVAQHCPAQRQTLLFSATYPEEGDADRDAKDGKSLGILKLSAKLLNNPQQVRLKEKHSAQHIRQLFFEVREDERLHAVGQLLNHYRPASTLAFCNTKQQCRDLVEVLRAQHIQALELHGDLDQRDRDQVLVRFAAGSTSVLVATDIAARGLDIAQLAAVINVDISLDSDTHTHRIGRTGRLAAGDGDSEASTTAPGWAFSLAGMHDMGRVGALEKAQNFQSVWQPLSALVPTGSGPLQAAMQTLQILGGRKEKIRAGDVLGALTKDLGFDGKLVGKINVNDFSTYVAVHRSIAQQVLRKLSSGKVKGKTVKVRLLED
jgi:ATP-dependent RNA helicase DbpA